jgi:site-specific recombinase
LTRISDLADSVLKRAVSNASPWDLTALLNAADPMAALPERHLWLIRLFEWLRHAPLEGNTTPTPVLRLRQLLGVLDRHPDHRARVAGTLARFWAEVDSTALLADFGFAPRTGLWGEFGRRLRARMLPLTPATTDLGDLFALLLPDRDDAVWLNSIDSDTLARIVDLLAAGDTGASDWREPFFEAITILTSAVRAAGLSPLLRRRMSLAQATEGVRSRSPGPGDSPKGAGPGTELRVHTPFRQLAQVAGQVTGQLREHAEARDPEHATTLLHDVQFLRGLLDACRRCAASVDTHLEAHGVSVDVVFEADQLTARTHRIDKLLDCVLSPEPARECVSLWVALAHEAEEQRGFDTLFTRHYSLLARKVAERSAETGEHYITRDAAEYRAMLGAALGGGAVIAGTTFVKFGLLALGLSAFWGGLWAGFNYAASFVLIYLLHWTVATKQPAMTAPAMAHKLVDVDSDEAVEAFVDEVANLIRSQAAGIIGNLAAVVPVVLAVQYGALLLFGAPLIGAADAQHVLDTSTLWGPTPLFAAFTGVLLFASSLIAGWVENWFVWHRLDSAIAWNPRIIARLGQARAARWAGWLRNNVSGLASNISLGLMLGLVPALAMFLALPLEVRHVTLSTGQLAAAVAALGAPALLRAEVWWCVAGIACTGALNLGVSFYLAFKVALRSRGIRPPDRRRLYGAIVRRLRSAPASFILPPG